MALTLLPWLRGWNCLVTMGRNVGTEYISVADQQDQKSCLTVLARSLLTFSFKYRQPASMKILTYSHFTWNPWDFNRLEMTLFEIWFLCRIRLGVNVRQDSMSRADFSMLISSCTSLWALFAWPCHLQWPGPRELTNVTLVVEDDRANKAHKLVLKGVNTRFGNCQFTDSGKGWYDCGSMQAMDGYAPMVIFVEIFYQIDI